MSLIAFFKSLLRSWLISFMAFGLIAVLVVGQFALAISMPWKNALQLAERDWLQWALVAPFIFMLVWRFPLGRAPWKTALPAHLLCGAATVVFCNWWSEDLIAPPAPPQGWHRRFDHPPEGERHAGNPPPNAGHTIESGSSTSIQPAPPPPPQPPGGPGPQNVPPGGGPRQERHWPGDRHATPWWRNPWRAFFVFGFRVPIYLAIVSVAHAAYFFRSARDRERRSAELEAGLAKARLEALRMQLQPHFLFNALNAIAELVHKDADAADEMLGALSDLHRLTLETADCQELTLKREMEFVEKYLAIERIRFGERLQYDLEIAPETSAALVPAFILQPLIENAVRHGLEPKLRDGKLLIRSSRKNGTLLLQVHDNGKGAENVAALREGIGLSNTRARLKELYGAKGELNLATADGFHVDIRVPFHCD